jgi:hypothetical protein
MFECNSSRKTELEVRKFYEYATSIDLNICKADSERCAKIKGRNGTNY